MFAWQSQMAIYTNLCTACAVQLAQGLNPQGVQQSRKLTMASLKHINTVINTDTVIAREQEPAGAVAPEPSTYSWMRVDRRVRNLGAPPFAH